MFELPAPKALLGLLKPWFLSLNWASLRDPEAVTAPTQVSERISNCDCLHAASIVRVAQACALWAQLPAERSSCAHLLLQNIAPRQPWMPSLWSQRMTPW